MRIVFDLPADTSAEQAEAIMALLPYKVYDHGIFPAVCDYKDYTHFMIVDVSRRDKWMNEVAHALAMVGATNVGVYQQLLDMDNKYFNRRNAHNQFSHLLKQNLRDFRGLPNDPVTVTHEGQRDTRHKVEESS